MTAQEIAQEMKRLRVKEVGRYKPGDLVYYYRGMPEDGVFMVEPGVIVGTTTEGSVDFPGAAQKYIIKTREGETLVMFESSLHTYKELQEVYNEIYKEFRERCRQELADLRKLHEEIAGLSAGEGAAV